MARTTGPDPVASAAVAIALQREVTALRLALAAREAECAELRALFMRSHGYLSMPEWCKVNIDPDATGEAQRFHDVCADIQRTLSRPPGSTEALKAWGVKVARVAWNAGWSDAYDRCGKPDIWPEDVADNDEADMKAATVRYAAIVARLLPGDGAVNEGGTEG